MPTDQRGVASDNPALRRGTGVPVHRSAEAGAFATVSSGDRHDLELQHEVLRAAKDELERAVRRYADLYDNLPIGYVVVTSLGEVVCANPAALELLQESHAGIVGKAFGAYLDGTDARRFAAHVERCAESGSAEKLELTLELAAGASATVQVAMRAPRLSEGEPRHVHLALTDITELKTAQRALEEIDREQEAFSYSISHDLRSPLVTISNYAGIVLSEHGEQIDSESRGMLQRIESAAGRMEETLKGLLEYSALAREHLTFQTLDLTETVRDVLLEHRAAVQQSGAEIHVGVPMPTVRASRAALVRVLGQLLSNALKYRQPDQPPRVRITAESIERHVVIRMQDAGIGIEARHHERIFRIFERLHGYSRYPGSGIGLAIARRAVERMRGRIWVESELGKGSTFCVELPRG
jgi:PAS domain S-box-containing protein